MHAPPVQVVAFDMRGYGESDKPVGRQHYVIPALASDAAAIVKALGHEKCGQAEPCCLSKKVAMLTLLQQHGTCLHGACIWLLHAALAVAPHSPTAVN